MFLFHTIVQYQFLSSRIIPCHSGSGSSDAVADVDSGVRNEDTFVAGSNDSNSEGESTATSSGTGAPWFEQIAVK